jgi:hypothetical protein
MAEPTPEPEDDGTLQYLFEIHQDVIDDCLVNPIPAEVSKLIGIVYAEAERRGRTVVQWRITFQPRPPMGTEAFYASPDDLAYLAGRRVIKMTAHTTAVGEKAANERKRDV